MLQKLFEQARRHGETVTSVGDHEDGE